MFMMKGSLQCGEQALEEAVTCLLFVGAFNELMLFIMVVECLMMNLISNGNLTKHISVVPPDANRVIMPISCQCEYYSIDL